MEKLMTLSKRLEKNQKQIVKYFGDLYLWKANWRITNAKNEKLWAKEVTIEKLMQLQRSR